MSVFLDRLLRNGTTQPVPESTEYGYTPTVQAVIELEIVEIKEEPIIDKAVEPMLPPTSDEMPLPPLMQAPVPCAPVYVMNQEIVITSLNMSAFAVGCLAGGIHTRVPIFQTRYRLVC